MRGAHRDPRRVPRPYPPAADAGALPALGIRHPVDRPLLAAPDRAGRGVQQSRPGQLSPDRTSPRSPGTGRSTGVGRSSPGASRRSPCLPTRPDSASSRTWGFSRWRTRSVPGWRRGRPAARRWCAPGFRSPKRPSSKRAGGNFRASGSSSCRRGTTRSVRPAPTSSGTSARSPRRSCCSRSSSPRPREIWSGRTGSSGSTTRPWSVPTGSWTGWWTAASASWSPAGFAGRNRHAARRCS